MRHIVSVSIALAILFNSVSPTGQVFASPLPKQLPQPSPIDKQLQKNKSQLAKIGIGGAVTLYMKNSDEFHGTISQLDNDTLQLADVDRRSTLTINLVDIKKVRDGLGYVNVFTGRRVTRPHKLRVLGLILATAAIALPVIVVAAAKD